MRKETGGPAFPGGAYDVNGLILHEAQYSGMTLRDYFAAKALIAGLSSGRVNISDAFGSKINKVALDAYRMADAMLKARAE